MLVQSSFSWSLNLGYSKPSIEDSHAYQKSITDKLTWAEEKAFQEQIQSMKVKLDKQKEANDRILDELQALKSLLLNRPVTPLMTLILYLLITYLGFQQTFILLPEIKEVCSVDNASQIWRLLFPPNFEGGNQQEVYKFAQEAVHKVLKRGLFLWVEKTKTCVFFFGFHISFLHFFLCLKGKCKNVAHPAILMVIHKFLIMQLP